MGRPAKLDLQHDRLTVAGGDVLDAASVEAAVSGQDALLCAFTGDARLSPTPSEVSQTSRRELGESARRVPQDDFEHLEDGWQLMENAWASRQKLLAAHERWRKAEGKRLALDGLEREGREGSPEIQEPCPGLPATSAAVHGKRSRTQAVTEPHRLSLERIAQARNLIDPVFLDSPQFEAESLGRELGCRLVVKVETLNPIRSFKGRGAEWFAASLEGRPHLVCTTAGNFGQGMAYAARKRGLRITIFAALNANPLKVERMRALGADVRLAGEDFDAAHREAKRFAAEAGARLVEDGREPALGEGAGTIGLELLRWPEPLDAILVPLGDGSLLAGVARWVKAHRPATRMIGVSASGSPAMERSWRSGRLQTTERAETIADGIAVTSPFPEAVADLAGLVDDVLLVDDDTLVAAIRRAHAELGLVLEPSGAASTAALFAHRERFTGQLVAALLTGGNVTHEQMKRWLAL